MEALLLTGPLRMWSWKRNKCEHSWLTSNLELHWSENKKVAPTALPHLPPSPPSPPSLPPSPPSPPPFHSLTLSQLSCSLTCLREQVKKLQVELNLSQARVKELQDKLKITEMILAMKDRANSAKRYEEQLKLKCCTLEQALEVAKACPTVVKCPSQERPSRVEMQLLKDCKKKVSGYFSTCLFHETLVSILGCGDLIA